MTAEQLTTYLRESIPLLAAVDVRALHCSPERVVLGAPLAANRNHHDSAFGGSLALMSILSGWSLLHVALQAEDLGARLVVQKSACDFREPVVEDLVAETRRPDAGWDRFTAMLRRHGRARIDVTTRIGAAGTDGVLHHGTFAAART